jgi:hypothetical protein
MIGRIDSDKNAHLDGNQHALEAKGFGWLEAALLTDDGKGNDAGLPPHSYRVIVVKKQATLWQNNVFNLSLR